LRTFVEHAWSIAEPGVSFVPGWHVDAICEHLEAVTRGQIRNLLITVPPRHTKSYLVSVFWPCWEWIDHPERRWLFSSYAESLAIRDSVKSRRLIQTPWYRTNWPHVELLAGQSEKRRYEILGGGYRIAAGVGGSITGEGGDRVMADDPNNVNEAESDTVRRGVIDWWDTVMSTRLNDPKTSAKVIIMQRCHQADLAGHVLEQGGYEHLSLPARYEGEKRATSIGWSDPRSEPGELLWPARFGEKEIADLERALGSYAAAGQLQQRPSPAEGGMLKRHWWRYWRPASVTLPPVPVKMPDGSIASVEAVPLPARLDVEIQSWDMAFKDLASCDFVVGQAWGALGADRFALDQVRDRLDFPATLQAVRAFSAKWPWAVAKLVEDKANGPAVIAMLQHEIAGLIPVEPQGGKQARAAAVSPQIEAGNVYLPHPSLAPWVEGFIEECATFPNGKHDDQVDTATQALIRLSGVGECETTLLYFGANGELTEDPDAGRISISPY
jgi:predicted phage terminase large subunit-like protein